MFHIGTPVSMSMLRLIPCFVTIVVCMGGCNRSGDYPRVVYTNDRPAVVAKHVVQVGKIKIADIDTTNPAPLVLPKRVTTAEGISFKGTLDLAKTLLRPHGVLVLVKKRDDKNKEVIVNSMAAPVSKDGAMLNFDIQLNSPLAPGTYFIDVLAMATDHPMLCLSRGELNVE